MDIPADKLPRHVAIIMDGNGRWAQERGLARTEGHRAGAEAARDVAQCCVDLGIPVLTLYAFSTENWNRPRSEVTFLMSNLRKFLREHRDEFAENGIRLRPIGNVEGLPASVRRELQATVEATAEGQKLTLCLALNYGAHEEITRAVRRIAREVERGELEPGEIDESTIEAQLDTAGLPELDLMIRTGGEMRVSNFLLWQLHYAEIYVTETYWPDFREEEFGRALHDFARRQRRFGRVPEEEADAEQSDQDARRSVAR